MNKQARFKNTKIISKYTKFVSMPVYFFKITLKSRQVITGLRQYQTHDIDLVYRKTYEKAYAKFHSSLVDFDVCMVHKKSKHYDKWFKEQGMKKDAKS